MGLVINHNKFLLHLGLYLKDMINKVKIGLVFETKDIARDFIHRYAPESEVKLDNKYGFICETPILHFVWIKAFTEGCGQRLNFVFTTEEIRNTIWFDKVIRPMQWLGTSTIEEVDYV